MAVDVKDKEAHDINPGQQSWDSTVARNSGASSSLSDYEQSALNDIENNYSVDGDDSQENANIRTAKNAEENPRESQPPAPIEKEESGEQLSRKQKAVQFMKKKGPLSLILTLFFGATGMLGMVTAPGYAIVQLKEAFVGDLNDTVASSDVRMQHVIRAKMKDQTKGFCTKSVSFRCKYSSMSKREAKRFTRAGLILDPKTKNKLGRYKPQTLSYHNSKGEKVTVQASEFSNRMRTDPEFRAKMFKAYNPRFTSLRDKVAGKVREHFKVSLKRALSGTKKDMDKQVDENIKNGTKEMDGRKIHEKKDGDETRYVDESGNDVTDEVNKLPEEDKNTLIGQDENRKSLEGFKSGGNSVKSMLSHGFKAANIIGGAQASVCSIRAMLKIMSLAAKNIKYAQLIHYVMPLLNTADAIKTGDATMESVEYLGDIATHIDTRDMVFDENSGDIGAAISGKYDDVMNRDQNNPTSTKATKNPHQGENAFDSVGFKASAYGEMPNADLRESQFNLGGGLTGSITKAVQKLDDFALGVSDDSCALWENPLVQLGGMAVGIAAIFVTGGGSVAIQGAKMAAQMVLTTLITTYAQSMISDILGGDAVNSKTQGIDSGNAWFAGSGALLGSTASSHGLNPLSTKEEIQQSQKLAATEKEQYAEVARLEAKDTPLDIYNQYSFLGSIAAKIYPVAHKSSSFAALAFSSPLTYLSTAVAGLSPTASAAITSPAGRFQKCDDPSFQSINLGSADFMCNIRFGNSPDEINADPEKVVDWMIDAGQIDSESGEVLSNADAVNKAAQVPVTAQQTAAILHDEDDPNPPAEVASIQKQLLGDTKVSLADANPQVPQANEPQDAVKNVRTYAHWLRFCRYGVEGGRKVNFGDKDGEEKNALTGITNDQYGSDGRECLKANACKAGENPNGTDTEERDNGDGTKTTVVKGDGDKAMKTRCRPPQYSIYSIYELDKSSISTLEDEDQGDQEKTEGLATGDAKELAKQVAENPNISFVDQSTKDKLIEFSKTGTAIGACGDPMVINPLLSGVLLAEAKNYKILINNFGFQGERSCDGGQHPKGNAVDINGLEKIGGGKTAWGTITYSGSEVGIITDFTKDWMNILADKDPARGGVGQLGCGGFNIINGRNPKWQGPDGNLHFDDSCNHLHIDVRDRNDNTKV